MNNSIFIAIFSFVLISCKTKELPTEPEPAEIFSHQTINFSFADSIAGIYSGNKITNSGPPNFIEYQEQVSIVVTDMRTEKECKFYVDLFDENVLLYKDGDIETSWNYFSIDPGNGSVYLTTSAFSNDSLHLEENYYSKFTNYTTFSFHGARQ